MRFRLLFLPIFCFLGIVRGYSQSHNDVDHYKTKTFDAAIFSEDIPLSIDTPLNRFTPTRSEVDSAERILQLIAIDTNHKSSTIDTNGLEVFFNEGFLEDGIRNILNNILGLLIKMEIRYCS